MVDKEIKIYRQVIRMIFPMIQRAKNNRSVWRACSVTELHRSIMGLASKKLDDSLIDVQGSKILIIK